MLGYLGNDSWRDLSDYVVHLTGAKHADSGRAAFRSILETGCIRSSGFERGKGVGTVRSVPWLSGTQCAACLSEIPLGWLGRLADRHGQFGVAVSKDYVRSVGGAPVWYLWRDSPVADVVQELVRHTMSNQDPDDTLWKITPFIENPGRGDSYRYEFDWEREWRVPGGMGFKPDAVRFLFAPETAHGWVRRVLSDLRIGSRHVFDPLWTMDHFQHRLAETDL